MIPYNFTELLFFFFIYCFIGWIIESTYVSLHEKKFVNRGFMHGPFIPIYGFGAMALLLVGTPLLKWPVAVFFAGLFTASVLEYVTGTVMEAVFKVRYWDYTGKFMNINGHVSLFTSICWGALACVEDYWLQKPLEALKDMLSEEALSWIVTAISVYFVVDLTLSFKAAFDMRALIIKMEKAREELRLMQKRLDVYMAYAEEDRKEFIEERKEKYEERRERFEDLTGSIEQQFTELKHRMEERPAAFADSVRDEIAELKEKYIISKANRSNMLSFKDIYKRGIILGNPTMGSKKFKESFEAIKEYVDSYRKKDKDSSKAEEELSESGEKH